MNATGNVNVRLMLLLAIGLSPALLLSACQKPTLDINKIDQALKQSGAPIEKGQAYRVTLRWQEVNPDTKIEGAPADSTFVFEPVLGGVDVTADLTLAQGQVDAVMDAALGHNMEVTSLHRVGSHEPPLMSMHLQGSGDQPRVIEAAGDVANALRNTKGSATLPKRLEIPKSSTLDTQQLADLLGQAGTMEGGVYHVIFDAPAQAAVQSRFISGAGTWATFYGTNSQAQVDGQIVALPDALANVVDVLRKSKLHVTAVGNQSMRQEPQRMFVEFRGQGRAAELAKVVAEAVRTRDVTIRDRQCTRRNVYLGTGLQP